jgi:hypothetical protein
MKTLSTYLTGVMIIAALASCNTKKQPASPPVIESRIVKQTKGTDCNLAEDARKDCAIVDASLPQLKAGSGSTALGNAITTWADKFFIGILTYSDYPETNAAKALPTIDAAIKRFHAMHDDAAGAVVAGLFHAKAKHETLLNDGRYLTLQITGESYQGGNRGLKDRIGIATFDVQSGKQLGLNELVKDQAGLMTIAETAFADARHKDFAEGFKFNEETKFTLPSALGMTATGLRMHYQDNEIYGIFGPTEIDIPYSQLASVLKVTPPAPGSAPTTKTLYKTEGDSYLIPDFEIEVELDEATAAYLKKRNETIRVIAYLSGTPADDKDADETGAIQVVDQKIELTGSNRLAKFTGLKFSKAMYEKLSPKDKDLDLLINVVSGFKSSEDNLIDCGLLSEKLSLVANQKHLITCTTIKASPTEGEIAPKQSAKGDKPSTVKAKSSAKTVVPQITVNEKGEIVLNGKKTSIDHLKKDLQSLLSTLPSIPSAISSKSIGTVGMGTRHEVQTLVDEAIAGAKWLRKKAALYTLQASIEKEMKVPMSLEVADYKTKDQFCFVYGRMVQPDGKPIDFSKTPFAKEAKAGSFSEDYFGLLKFDKGTWKVLDKAVGPTDIPFMCWWKEHKAPKELFGKDFYAANCK